MYGNDSAEVNMVSEEKRLKCTVGLPFKFQADLLVYFYKMWF